MSARDDLLAALRRAVVKETALPDLAGLGVAFEDPAAELAAAVTVVGGTCLRVADQAAAQRALAELPVFQNARRILSLVPGVAAGNVDLAGVTDPHQLEGVDLAVLPGEFGVAENGAIWIDGAALPHRAYTKTESSKGPAGFGERSEPYS